MMKVFSGLKKMRSIVPIPFKKSPICDYSWHKF